METYRIEVGHMHGVKPGNIVGAIANEAGLEARHIGRIEIFEDHALVDLPSGKCRFPFGPQCGIVCGAGRTARSVPDLHSFATNPP